MRIVYFWYNNPESIIPNLQKSESKPFQFIKSLFLIKRDILNIPWFCGNLSAIEKTVLCEDLIRDYFCQIAKFDLLCLKQPKFCSL